MALALILGTYLVLALEVFVYPGFSINRLNFNPEIVIVLCLMIVLVRSLFKPQKLLTKLLKFNQKYLFPLFLFGFIIFMLLEHFTFDNFVFSRFHIHPLSFGYLPIFSWGVSFVYFKTTGLKKYFYYLFLPLTLVGFWWLLMTDYLTFVDVLREDYLVEYLQFFLFLISAVFSFKLFKYFKSENKNKINAIIFLILSIGLFFIAGDEISWGQRLLGIETPEQVQEVNKQNEFTVHNLQYFQDSVLHLSYKVVGLYGAFSYLIVKYILPKKYNKLTLFTPKPYLFFCFFSVFAYYFIFDAYFEPLEIQIGKAPMNSWQEIFEAYLAFGLFGYVKETFKITYRG